MSAKSNVCRCGSCAGSKCTCGCQSGKGCTCGRAAGRTAFLQNHMSFGVAAVLSLALVAVLVSTQAKVVYAANQTLTGEITSSNCVSSHMSGMAARECTLQCVAHGHAYVFVSGGKVYQLADQTDKRLPAHAGETVTLTGDFNGNVISVSQIASKS